MESHNLTVLSLGNGSNDSEDKGQTVQNSVDSDGQPETGPLAKIKRRYRIRWHNRKRYHQTPSEDTLSTNYDPHCADIETFPESSRSTLQGSEVKTLPSLPTKAKAQSSKCQCTCKESLRFLTRLLSLALSTVGLTILMFFYTLLGGFLFHYIESPNEVRTKHGVQVSRRWHIDRLWNLTEQLNILHPQNWSELAEVIIANYTRQVYLATKVDGWDGKEDAESELQWSVAGAVLYSVTVVTTIGYGHIAPKTALGRVITILYAVIGIPLTLLSITHLGGFLATIFRFLYKNVLCGIFCTPFRRCRQRNMPNDAEEETEQNDVIDHAQTVIVETEQGAMVMMKQAEDGLDAGATVRRRFAQGLHSSYKLIVRWRRGIRNALYTEDNKAVTVPIYVSLALIGGYLALGALMFGLWEADWNFLIGCYFCFITLSTIGFGDFVPGTSFHPSATQEKLVLCSLYLIFGLALLAMCFDLMQEEARKAFRSLGRRLGISVQDQSPQTTSE